MSYGNFYPTSLEGIDVTTQRLSDYSSRKEVGCEPTLTQNHFQTRRYLSGEEKKGISGVDGRESSFKSYKDDQPIDLSVRKRKVPDQFLSLTSSVPTIFSSNPEHIFKIPVPPELSQTPGGSTNKYSRLSKAVNQTFVFSHQNPFIGSKPSIFQLKYNLHPDSIGSSTSEPSHTVTKASLKEKHQKPQQHKHPLPSRDLEPPQKQPKMFNIPTHTVKEEPMESMAFSHNTGPTYSAETFDWPASYSLVPIQQGLEDAQNAAFEAVNFQQQQQTFETVSSSENKQQPGYFDLDRPYLLSSQEEKSLDRTVTGFKEDIVKQDETIDSSQRCLLSSACPSEPNDVTLCQVCGDLAAGFYCGAYICEACKKFFIRASKMKQMKYVCLKSRNCKVTKESRVHCQYCRYQKCLSLNMLYHKDGQKSEDKNKVQEIPCRVCSAPSSGFHFGALTCEGCKGFFRRMVNEREPGTYTCGKGGNCEVNSMTRNMCKACRYEKCLMIGMSIEGSRIGRQPNAVKHAISLEVKKQAAQRENSKERNESKSNHTVNSFESMQEIYAGEIQDEVVKQGQGNFYQTSDYQYETVHEAGKKSGGYNDFSWRDNRESDGMVSSSTESLDMIAFKNHFGSNQMHTYRPGDFTGVGEVNSEFQNVSSGEVCEGHVQSLSGDSVSQTHPTRCLQNSKEQLSHSNWQNNPKQKVNTYTDNTYQCQKDFIYGNAANQYHKPYNMDNNEYTDGFIHVQVSCKTPNDKKRKSSEGYNSFQSEIKDPHASPSNAKNKYEPLEWNMGGNTINSNSEYSFRAPGQIHMENSSTSPYNVADGYRSEVERSRSLSPCRQQGEPNSSKNNLKHRHESQGNFKPCPYHRRSHGHESKEVERGATSSSRSGSLDRLVPGTTRGHAGTSASTVKTPPGNSSGFDSSPGTSRGHAGTSGSTVKTPPGNSSGFDSSPGTSRGHAVTSGSNSTAPPDVSNNQPGQNVTSFPVAGDVTQPSSSASHPDQSGSTRGQPHPAPSPANHTMTSFDKEMLVCANTLGGICLVEEAKKDDCPVEKLKDAHSSWDLMMDYFHFHAKFTVRFAKKVPGFREFKLDDQVKLLRSASYILVLLNHTREYEPRTGFYNYFNIPKKAQIKLLEFFPDFEILHTHFKHCGILAKELNITEVEYGYLSSMLLLDEECEGLEEPEQVRQLKDTVMAGFQQYEADNFPNGSLRFGQMLLRLSEFSQFSMQHNVAVGQVITKQPSLPIPQLYAEMYA